jgi:hypothetical protein
MPSWHWIGRLIRQDQEPGSGCEDECQQCCRACTRESTTDQSTLRFFRNDGSQQESGATQVVSELYHQYEVNIMKSLNSISVRRNVISAATATAIFLPGIRFLALDRQAY